ARRAGPIARSIKWIKRHPGVAVLGACLLVLALVAGFFAWQAKRAHDQLLAEQRQAALDKAVLEAMSGDAPAALAAIADAESKGAPPGQLNLLRGLVELQEGNTKNAIVYLEQADTQLPDTVAVKALLAQAYLENGQWEHWERLFHLMDG